VDLAADAVAGLTAGRHPRLGAYPPAGRHNGRVLMPDLPAARRTAATVPGRAGPALT